MTKPKRVFKCGDRVAVGRGGPRGTVDVVFLGGAPVKILLDKPDSYSNWVVTAHPNKLIPLRKKREEKLREFLLFRRGPHSYWQAVECAAVVPDGYETVRVREVK